MNHTEGSVYMAAGLCALVLLFAPVLVHAEANATILFDDFDTVKPDWDEFHGLPYTIRDGYVFLNLNAKTAGEMCVIHLTENVRYSGLTMRLRCLNITEGWSAWGFRLNQYDLKFSWCSNQSEHVFQGLSAVSVVDREFKLLKPITGIDITDWHTYTVIWEKDNGTFLVDSEVVASTNQVPKYKMGIILGVTGWRWGGDMDRVVLYDVELLADQCIQIDYIRIFSVPESAFLSILCLILLPAIRHRWVGCR